MRTSGWRTIGAATAAVLAIAAGLVLSPDAHALVSRGSAWGEVTNGKNPPTVNGSAENTPLWAVRVDGWCSGVAIGGPWVLTARHCLRPDVRDPDASEPDGVTLSFDTIAAGANIVVEGKDAFGEVSRFLALAAYWRSDSEVALIRLSREFRLTAEDGLEYPIAMPMLRGDRAPHGKRGVMYGYGMTSIEDTWVGGGGTAFDVPGGFTDGFEGGLYLLTPQPVTVRYGDAEVLYEPGTGQEGDSGGPLVYGGRVVGIFVGTNIGTSGTQFHFAAALFYDQDWINAEVRA